MFNFPSQNHPKSIQKKFSPNSSAHSSSLNPALHRCSTSRDSFRGFDVEVTFWPGHFRKNRVYQNIAQGHDDSPGSSESDLITPNQSRRDQVFNACELLSCYFDCIITTSTTSLSNIITSITGTFWMNATCRVIKKIGGKEEEVESGPPLPPLEYSLPPLFKSCVTDAYAKKPSPRLIHTHLGEYNALLPLHLPA